MPIAFEEKVVELDQFRITVALSRLENGVLIFVSDSSHRIGTIGVGVPTPFGEISPTATSVLVGTRFQSAVRAIADIAAQHFEGIAVVNLFMSKEQEELISAVLQVVRRVILETEKPSRS
jgi:hypothetical protein